MTRVRERARTQTMTAERVYLRSILNHRGGTQSRLSAGASSARWNLSFQEFRTNDMAGSRYDDALPDAASRFKQAAESAGQHIWEQFGRATRKQITQSLDLDNIAERACRQVGYKGPGDPYP